MNRFEIPALSDSEKQTKMNENNNSIIIIKVNKNLQVSEISVISEAKSESIKKSAKDCFGAITRSI